MTYRHYEVTNPTDPEKFAAALGRVADTAPVVVTDAMIEAATKALSDNRIFSLKDQARAVLTAALEGETP